MSAEYDLQADSPFSSVIDFDQLPYAVQEYQFDLERSLSIMSDDHHNSIFSEESFSVIESDAVDEPDWREVDKLSDPVKLHLSQINHPILSYEQEQMLFRMGPQHGRRDVPIESVTSHPDYVSVLSGFSPKDRRRFQHIVADSKNLQGLLVQMNLRLTVMFAKKYANGADQILENIQEGSMGLMKAVEMFDPDKPVDENDPEGRKIKFSTYGAWWIRQNIGRGIHNNSRTIRLPVHVEEKLNKTRKLVQTLQQERGREITYSELRAELEDRGENHANFFAEQVTQGGIAYPLSLDISVSDDGEKTLGDFIPAPDTVFDAAIYAEELHGHVSDVFDGLEEREEYVLRERLGFGGEQRSLLYIGKQLGISRERVRQIEARALEKLRHPSRNRQLRPFVDEEFEGWNNNRPKNRRVQSSAPVEKTTQQERVSVQRQPEKTLSFSIKGIDEGVIHQEPCIHLEKHPSLPDELQNILMYYYNGRKDKRPILERLSLTYDIPIADLEKLFEMASVMKDSNGAFSPNGGTVFTAGDVSPEDRVRILKTFNLSEKEIAKVTGLPIEIVSFPPFIRELHS